MASIDSLNALGEVLQTPEPGLHCPTSISPDVAGAARARAGPNACLERPTGDEHPAPRRQAVLHQLLRRLLLPDHARRARCTRSWRRCIALTTTESRFFRVDTLRGREQVLDQLLPALQGRDARACSSGVIRNDPSAYGGYVSSVGALHRRRRSSTSTSGARSTPPMPPYMQPGAKRVDTPVNKTIRYYALGLALANLNSTWDCTLDISNYLAVDSQGLDRRRHLRPRRDRPRVHPPADRPDLPVAAVRRPPGIGAQLVDELNQIVGQPGVPRALPPKYGVLRQRHRPARLADRQDEPRDRPGLGQPAAVRERAPGLPGRRLPARLPRRPARRPAHLPERLRVLGGGQRRWGRSTRRLPGCGESSTRDPGSLVARRKAARLRPGT